MIFRSRDDATARKAHVLGWPCWALGVALLPLGALVVGPDPGYALPPIFFGGSRGLIVWCLWGCGFAAMFAGMRLLRDVPPRMLVLALAIGGAVVATAPALDSHDPYAYLLYGEMATHGSDPWSPSVLPIWNATTAQGVHPWGNPPVASVYGPTFIAIEATIVGTLRDASTYQLLIVQRVISLAAAIGIALMLRGRQRAVWALHPLVLFETALGAHNDVLMLVILVLAMRIRNPLFSGIAIACAGCVKIVGLAAGFLRPRAFIGLAAGLAAVAVFDRNSLGIDQLRRHQELDPLNSPIMLLRALFNHGLHLQHGTLLAKFLVWGIAGLAILAISLRQRRSNGATIGLLIISAIPIIYPWYFLWPLCAATTASRRFAEPVAAIAAASFLLDLPAFVAPTFVLEYGATAVLLLASGLILPRDWRPAPQIQRLNGTVARWHARKEPELPPAL